MNLETLTLLFTICILVRLSFVYLVYNLKGRWLQFSSILGFTIALGFVFMIIIDRKSGAFGQSVWWENYRYIHALLYLTFGILALRKNKYSYVPLLIDAILGTFFFINHRYLQNKDNKKIQVFI